MHSLSESFGFRPFEGKTHGEIVLLVVNREKRPSIPDYCPDGYAELLEDCWRQSHLERPGFPEAKPHSSISHF